MSDQKLDNPHEEETKSDSKINTPNEQETESVSKIGTPNEEETTDSKIGDPNEQETTDSKAGDLNEVEAISDSKIGTANEQEPVPDSKIETSNEQETLSGEKIDTQDDQNERKSMLDSELETQTEPKSTLEDKTEKYSEFITEKTEPLPYGDFFDDAEPLINKVDAAIIEEELTDLAVEVVEKEEKITRASEKLEKIEKINLPDNVKASSRRVTLVDDKRKSFFNRKSISFRFSITPEGKGNKIFRSSVNYDAFPRLGIEGTKRVSGDFKESSIVEDKTAWLSLLEYTDTDESEEEEEKLEEEEPKREIGEQISRHDYYEKHAKLKQEISARTIENNILQRKIAIYFRRKNMDYAWKDSGHGFENKNLYHQRLEEYSNVIKHDNAKRNTTDTQMQTLRDAIERRSKFLEELFHDFQKKEKDVGLGLIYNKTGTEIPEKLVLQYLNRQKTNLEKLTSMRLVFLQLKRLVTEKESAIQSINTVDEEHRLHDFEKLRDDNKIFSDKIEEKLAELTALRCRNNDTIQILAHLKEKIAAFDSDIMDLKDLLKSVESNVEEVRSRLMHSKKERDAYRTMLVKLQEDSGLLTERVLLKDMERCSQEVNILKEQLKSLTTECGSNIKKIRRIRKLIEERMESSTKKTIQKDKKRIKSFRKRLSKEEPTTFNPILPEGVMDHHYFEQFQPTVTRINLNKQD
ncbi:coiled-coil domain-containing protein 96-like [Diorhabda sublineata]|uniref:coiled-coil domain-containing protein 96-like n=1 Tax=Diorhabda sublineata TaxID=1163346 RepID=UPI0024E1860F|nr:coiled-coil domain-containing protein 96-like [Diorhabda sublineata]